MLLHLDLEFGPVFEGPADDVRLRACAFDVFGFGESGPEVRE